MNRRACAHRRRQGKRKGAQFDPIELARHSEIQRHERIVEMARRSGEGLKGGMGASGAGLRGVELRRGNLSW